MLFTRNNGNFANRYRFVFTLQKNEGRTVRTDKNYNNRKMEKVWVMMLATLMASSTMMAGNGKKSTTYFMAQIDGCEPFKVGFNAGRDSVVTLATALPKGCIMLR